MHATAFRCTEIEAKGAGFAFAAIAFQHAGERRIGYPLPRQVVQGKETAAAPGVANISDSFAALNEGRLSAPRDTDGLTVDEIGLMMGGAHGLEVAHV